MFNNYITMLIYVSLLLCYEKMFLSTGPRLQVKKIIVIGGSFYPDFLTSMFIVLMQRDLLLNAGFSS